MNPDTVGEEKSEGDADLRVPGPMRAGRGWQRGACTHNHSIMFIAAWNGSPLQSNPLSILYTGSCHLLIYLTGIGLKSGAF